MIVGVVELKVNHGLWHPENFNFLLKVDTSTSGNSDTRTGRTIQFGCVLTLLFESLELILFVRWSQNDLVSRESD